VKKSEAERTALAVALVSGKRLTRCRGVVCAPQCLIGNFGELGKEDVGAGAGMEAILVPSGVSSTTRLPCVCRGVNVEKREWVRFGDDDPR
jgi:hypothetical protein